MILITGTARIKDGQREAFEAVARPMLEASRAEEGCHAYRYSFDLEDPTLLGFHEQWESEEALAAHFATPHMAVFIEAMGPLVAGAPRIRKWDADELPFG